MKKIKSLMAFALVLCMAFSLCACGGDKNETKPTETTPAPSEPNAPTIITEPAEDEGDAYVIKVVDEGGNPIAGAMVQMCKDTCFPGVTDESGVVKFELPEDSYKVSFLALPAGYDYVDETQEFYFADGSMELTITLKAVA